MAGYPTIPPPPAEPSLDVELGSHMDQVYDLAKSFVVVKFRGKTSVLDVSSAVTVDDVERTLRALFGIRKDIEVLLRRESTGAVVIPGPKLPHGFYILEELRTGWDIAYANLRETHYPVVKQNLLTAAEEAKRKSAESAKLLGSKAKDLHRGVQSGVQTGLGHAKRAMASSGTVLRQKVKNATLVAKEHSETNSHTWTAKLFKSLVRCAPLPMAFLMGVPVEELVRSQDEPESSVTGETVPLSRPAQENSATSAAEAVPA